MAEKTDLSSAYRRLKSPNIKTRKRALKIIHEYKQTQNNQSKCSGYFASIKSSLSCFKSR